MAVQMEISAIDNGKNNPAASLWADVDNDGDPDLLVANSDVLRLSKGAVVPLDRLAGDPVDIFVNGRLIARGEVLILNDNFCVRVAELVAGESPAAAESNR